MRGWPRAPERNEPMPYQNMISCRLNDYDRDVLGEAVSRSGMSQSEYLRSLLRIPAEARSQTTVYAVDGKTMGKLATELIRWGRHYNQAVHALNTIALYMRKGRPPNPAELDAKLGHVGLLLEEVEGGRRDLEYALCEIAESITVRRD